MSMYGILYGMAHHAYFYTGDIDHGIDAALLYAEKNLNLAVRGNPDVITLRYQTLPVLEARRLTQLIHQGPVAGDQKIIIVAAGRFYEESQNAFLKAFEEPPQGITLVLVLPTEGMLLPTLRSRLIELPTGEVSEVLSPEVSSFLSASAPEREKIIAKIVERTKSDNEVQKQEARLEALSLAKGVQVAVYTLLKKGSNTEDLVLFAKDLDVFIPILHDRSAPIKPIFEHLLLVLPPSLTKKI